MHKNIVLVVLFVFAISVTPYAQRVDTTGATKNNTNKNSVKEQTNEPKPYGENEFPKWLKDLRRGEIIFFGSIPFMLFFSFEGYDLYRYFSNGMNPAYTPWPFRGYNAVPYADSEKMGILISSLSLSLVVAVSDYLLGLFQNSKTIEENSGTSDEK